MINSPTIPAMELEEEEFVKQVDSRGKVIYPSHENFSGAIHQSSVEDYNISQVFSPTVL